MNYLDSSVLSLALQYKKQSLGFLLINNGANWDTEILTWPDMSTEDLILKDLLVNTTEINTIEGEPEKSEFVKDKVQTSITKYYEKNSMLKDSKLETFKEKGFRVSVKNDWQG